jgi:LysM repeat protein
MFCSRVAGRAVTHGFQECSAETQKKALTAGAFHGTLPAIVRRLCVRAWVPSPEVNVSRSGSKLAVHKPWIGIVGCVLTIGCASWGVGSAHSSVRPSGAADPHFHEPPVYAGAAVDDSSSAPFAPIASGAHTLGDERSAGADETLGSGAEHSPPSDEVDSEFLEDDDGEGSDAPPSLSPVRRGVAKPHPLASVTAAELRTRLQRDPASLGPMSIGKPNGGALLNAVQLPEDPRWERVAPGASWGTQETMEYLSSAVGRVVAQFPDTLPLPIGDISDRDGGPIRPHRSHQSGADVDVGYYYKPQAHRWYQRATKDNLDLPRTWALVRALITDTDVRMILIDHGIQSLLREYAESIHEDSAWLDDIFGVKGGRRAALIRHAPGHATHLHVRFYNPVAEETARRCYPDLIALKKVKVSPSFVSYKARKGDTLLALAKRFGTTVKAIKRANALRSNTILAKRVYKIPSSAPQKITMGGAEVVPPRRLPPVMASTQSLSRL